MRFLAAYRLGHFSRALRHWQTTHWRHPYDDGTDVSVGRALGELDTALVALADVINVGVMAELRRVLSNITRLERRLKQSLARTGKFEGVRFGRFQAPGENSWRNLCALTDRAILGDEGLRCWYSAGVGLGDCLLQLCRSSSPMGPSFPEGVPLPDLRTLPSLIQRVSCGARISSTLQAVSSLADETPQLTPEGFYGRLVESLFGPENLHADDPYFAAYMTLRAAYELNRAIREDLPRVALESEGLAEPGLPAGQAPVCAVEETGGKGEDSLGSFVQSVRSRRVTDEDLRRLHQWRIRQGYLGLALIAGQREVWRVGFRPLRLAGRERPWQLLQRLYQRGAGFYSKSDLARDVWNPDEGGIEPSDSAIWTTIDHLEDELETIGITIECERGLGWRMTELSTETERAT